ncbi:hypothetical protein GW17_00036224 [Ensete ventricosum]|nr:hypothetical protein GW17_00036224 [Ensete ventricosum]RZR79465.1 hypothetical protein BHM03_00005194 [Ensete ventricosum]
MGGTYRSVRLPIRGPPATGRFYQNSTVGGRLKKKSTVGGRLRKKKGRRGKEKKKKRGRKNTSPARRPRPPTVAARGLPARRPCPPAVAARGLPARRRRYLETVQLTRTGGLPCMASRCYADSSPASSAKGVPSQTDSLSFNTASSVESHRCGCCTLPFMESCLSLQENLQQTSEVSHDKYLLGENTTGGSGAAESGQSKPCARGHWRPAEDSKLKQLVELYGPQNWNLIAEKLEGRSGSELS